MNGSSDHFDETPPAPSDSTKGGREIRRFDAPHPKPRMRSLRAVTDDATEAVEPMATQKHAATDAPDSHPEHPHDVDSDGPLEADLLACDRVADRLMSTQAAQLAEYLRNRQAELVRQQRQLEEQQHALSKARQAHQTETARETPRAAATPPAAVEPAGGADDTIRMLLETLEQQRLGHQATLQAVLRRDEPRAVLTTPSNSSPASPQEADRSVDSTAAAQRPAPSSTTRTVPAPKMLAGRGSRSANVAPPPARSTDTPSAPRAPESVPAADTAPETPVDAPRQAAAARQLLAEARRIHLETLEQRMVIEQLRLQLSAAAPSVDLQTAFRRLQAQFQRQHRQAWEELAEQEDETRELLAELEQRQAQLRRQRRDLQNWVAQRYEDFEQLIGRLSAREQELERQQREIDQLRQRECDQAAEYQRQIRQLTAQLRCRDELGRVA